MIEVTKLWTSALSLDRIDLFWEIAPVPGPRRDEDTHEIFNYEFSVLRSVDSALGPYDVLKTGLIDAYYFRDIQVSRLHKWREYFYKLRVTDRRTGAFEDTGPTAAASAPPDLIAAEIQRQEDLLFREFTGRKCWLFPARSFGPLCTCFDRTLSKRTRSGHLACFDTGFLGGYMSPVEVFVQFDPSPKSSTATSLQELQQTDTTARMISFPPVNVQDILVESSNRRWRVLNVRQTERLRAVVRQELQLHEIPKGDIEYSLPINIDERLNQPSAPRNFTNPQNVDDNGNYEDILSAYGHPLGTLR